VNTALVTLHSTVRVENRSKCMVQGMGPAMLSRTTLHKGSLAVLT
jgi:hypothetical protein